MFYVYVLKSKRDGQLYTGYSEDLRRRIAEHNSGQAESTHGRGPFELVYYESYKAKADARHREDMLKLRAKALGQLKQRIRNSLS